MHKWMASYRARKKAEFFATANSQCGRISFGQLLLHPLLSLSYKKHEKEMSLQRAAKAKKSEARLRLLDAETKKNLDEIKDGIGHIEVLLQLRDKVRMN